MTDQETNGAKAATKAIPDAVEETTEEEEKSLTDELLEHFSREVRESGDAAYDRWGLALFHSLDDEQTQVELIRSGWKPKNALGYYNLGCHLTTAEDFKGAAKAFEKARELDPELQEALFNHALATERTGDAKAATKLWKHYLEVLQEDDEETAAVKQHLTELADQ